MSEVSQLKHHNELLVEALSKIIIASGIVRKDIVSFSGPELLMFSDDVVRMLESIDFQQIFDPKNDHLFTAAAAMEAFKDVKPSV